MSGLLLGVVGGQEIAIPSIGQNVYGGYYTGVIDTRSSGGLRYLLIVAPKSVETVSRIKTSNTGGPSAGSSTWNGLATTEAMYAENTSLYPAATYCYNLSYTAEDGGSRWYVPAKDELELIYRNLKPSTSANVTINNNGKNDSSSPAGAAYTSSNPGQTSVTAFRVGGAQALDTDSISYYLSCTQPPAPENPGSVWAQIFRGQDTGYQLPGTAKTSLYNVRPVRRIIF